jgi:hypothetical protein
LSPVGKDLVVAVPGLKTQARALVDIYYDSGLRLPDKWFDALGF